MGNCLPKLKKNRVGPEADDRDVSESIGKATDFSPSNIRDQEDMVKALKDNGQEPVISGHGIAFSVAAHDKLEDARLPARLRNESVQNTSDQNVTYTEEEEALMDEILGSAEREERRQRLEDRMLMAECMREAQLRERQEKARQGHERREEVMRRRNGVEKTMDQGTSEAPKNTGDGGRNEGKGCGGEESQGGGIGREF